ncbi:hypothetical protein ACFW88_18085 [Streptomyces anandii]|uniref:ABC transporter substrate-binding protein n=1 Tax=Streptomyces anandii TaxID=285454 RepID=A0ABW6H735_9ACTN
MRTIRTLAVPALSAAPLTALTACGGSASAGGDSATHTTEKEERTRAFLHRVVEAGRL